MEFRIESWKAVGDDGQVMEGEGGTFGFGKYYILTEEDRCFLLDILQNLALEGRFDADWHDRACKLIVLFKAGAD